MQLPVKYKKNLDVSIRAKALRHAVLQNRIETTRFNIETPILKTNYFVWESMHMDSYVLRSNVYQQYTTGNHIHRWFTPSFYKLFDIVIYIKSRL
jgi:hypothetical protein